MTYAQLLYSTRPFKYFGCLLFCLLVSVCVHAQAALPSLKPYAKKNGGDYIGMFFSKNAKMGWLGGSLGKIYLTEDGGITWREITTGVNGNIDAIFFLDNNKIGWAVGSKGMVLHSEDGGITWNRVENIPISKTLYAVTFLQDGKFGVAGGENGDIILTDDGGKHWTYVDTQYGNEIWSITLNSRENIFLAGDNLSLVTKKGSTWDDLIKAELSEKLDGGIITSIVTYDNRHLIGSTSKGYIIESNDAGISWNYKLVAQDKSIRALYFDTQMQHGWGVTSQGTILATENGGQTWQERFAFSEAPIILNAIQFSPDQKNGWVCGRANTFFRTSDGGATWQGPQNPSFDIREFYLSPDAKNLIATGSYGNLQFSLDGGDSWQRISPASFKTGFNGISYTPSTRRIFVAGDSLTIASATFGKDDWRVHNKENTKAKFNSITFFKDGETGFAVGSSALLMKTTDGGATWKKSNLSKDSIVFSDIYFDSREEKGLIVGSKGAMFYSADRGLSWKQLTFPDTSQSLISTCFDQFFKRGFVTTTSGKNDYHLYSTYDGGTTWTAVTTFPVNSSLQHISYRSTSGEVLVTTSDGDLYRSVDHGDTWFLIKPTLAARALSFINTDSNNVPVLMGSGGALIKFKKAVTPKINAFYFKHSNHAYIPVIEIDPDQSTNVMQAVIKIKNGALIDGVDKRYYVFTTTSIVKDSLQAWPETVFQKNDEYTFELSVFDGWNIVTQKTTFIYGVSMKERILTFFHWNKYPGDYKELLEAIAVNLLLLAVLYALFIIALFFVSPRHFVRWHEAVANSRLPFPEKLSKFLVLHLIRHPRSLDAFVELHRLKAIKAFQSVADVSSRPVWIPAPFELNAKKILIFSNPDFITNYIPGLFEIRKELYEDRTSIAIEGQGGVGKSTLAFQLAMWTSSANAATRLSNFTAIPVFINNIDENLDAICKSKVQAFTSSRFISDTLCQALLQNKRIVAVVDGLSEMNTIKADYISPEKGALYTNFVIYTSRKPVAIHEKTLIIPLGLRMEFLDNLLDGFTNAYVGAFRFGDKREILRGRIKRLISELYDESDGSPLPLGLLRIMVEKAAVLLDEGKNLSSDLPGTIAGLLDDYLESIFRNDDAPAESVKILRKAALISLGLEALLKPASVRKVNSENISPQWIPESKYLQYLPADKMKHFIVSGVLIQTGSFDDRLVKFTHDPVAEYLTCKELLIKLRDQELTSHAFDDIKQTIKVNNSSMYRILQNVASMMTVDLKD